MKPVKILILACIAITMLINMYADTWNYDLGTGSGSFATAGQSTTFLPTAPSGTARVRVGTAGGSINLENPGLAAIGTGTEIRIVAPSSAQYNKVAIYDYTPSQTSMMKFTMLLGSNLGGQVDSGIFYFMNGDGDRFSNNSGFSDDQTFVALRFTFGANGAITLSYRRTGAWTTINSTPVAQSSVLDFELFGNNSAQTVSYTYAGSSYSVAAGKFDMWINGSIYGDELLKSRLADGANIDSFMFYGDASDGNVANLFLDNITYQNSLEPDVTLPVELTSFTAVTTPQNLVRLDWITQSESGISGYYVYRNSVDRIMDAQIVSPLILPTNTTTEHSYTFTDNEVQSGTWYYWLQHLELGGYEAFHGPVYVLLNNNIDNGIPGIPQLTGLQSIYPNPFNPSTTIAFGLAKSDRVSLAVFNSRGQKVRDFDSIDLPSGNYTSVWNGTDNNGRILSSGVYTIRLKTGADSHVRKVVMLK